MANIYYCHPISKGSGILRAVLSAQEANHILSEQSACYVGQEFPKPPEELISDFAVIRLSGEGLEEKWQDGFYRFEAEITVIEDAVQACTSALSQLRRIPQSSLSLAYTSLVSGGKP